MLSNICLWAPSATLRDSSSILAAEGSQRWPCYQQHLCFLRNFLIQVFLTAAPQEFLHNKQRFQGAVGAALLGGTSECPHATPEQHKGTRQDQGAPGGSGGQASRQQDPPGAGEAAQGGQGLFLQHCVTMQHHHSCMSLPEIPYSSTIKGSCVHKEQGMVLWLHRLCWAAAFI